MVGFSKFRPNIMVAFLPFLGTMSNFFLFKPSYSTFLRVCYGFLSKSFYFVDTLAALVSRLRLMEVGFCFYCLTLD